MPVIPSQPHITSSVVLLIEGKDEVGFFYPLLKHFGWVPGVDIQPREVGGKYKFPTELPAFLNDPNFNRVKAYAIVRDADTSAKATLSSIQKLLKDYSQPCPSGHAQIASNGMLRVGIFIMPGNQQVGMLEDLCLSTVADHPIMPYVSQYMKHVEDEMQDQAPKNKSKAKMQAFLSGMPETVSSLGLAASKGYWSFGHDGFSELRIFLQHLIGT